jgi:hypothetical protein
MTTTTTPENPTPTAPKAETEAPPFTRPEKKSHVPAGKRTLIIAGIAALAALLICLFIVSHKLEPKKPHEQASKQAPVQRSAPAANAVVPANTYSTPSAAKSEDTDTITAGGVLATRNSLEAQKRHAREAEQSKPSAARIGSAQTHPGRAGSAAPASNQSTALPKTLGAIPPFQPPPFNGAVAGQPTGGFTFAGAPYQSASSSDSARAWNDEVSKPRIVFARKSVPAAVDAAQTLGPAITNFGLEPGFHVAARLEASATTAVAAPVTAVIEYNYEHDGQIVLPAGSRAIGRINSADPHGNMAIAFESILLPNGSTVPISAVAVDTNLRVLKGQVTGSSRGKAMLVATLSGIGQATAMMLGNNTSAALSGQDMVRAQFSQNMGNTADTQIAKIISNERIVVTLAGGTEFYLVFTKASLPQTASQPSSLAANASRTTISSSFSER